MNEEELRNLYIKFSTQLRDEKYFNEGIYDSIFDSLTFFRKQWSPGKTVPIRLFEICVDLMYVLSFINPGYSEDVKERVADAQNEVYGLLMAYD